MTGPHVSLMSWLRGCERAWVRSDLLAGITAAAIVLPKALAYATVAGLPIQVGLYTCFVPMLVYALLGTSRPLSVSTTTTLAILTGTALAQAVPDGDPVALAKATATLCLLTGSMLIAAAVLRLGFVANFISAPVLTGFKAGVAVVIVVDQLPKLLGLHIAKSGFIRDLGALAAALPHLSVATAAVGLLAILLLVAMEHMAPKAPAPLVAVALGIVAMPLLHLGVHGVTVVGHVPTGFASLTLPDLSLAGALWPAAAGIALMSFTESIAAGRAFVAPGESYPQPNGELWATGLGNVASAPFGCMPSGGGTSQTAVNRLAGAKTQLAGLVTSLVALATMLLLAPFIGMMPNTILAAIVIVYSIGLFKPADFVAIRSIRRTEFWWAVAALLGVVLLGTLKGILVAIVVSLMSLSYQSLNPPLYVLRRKPGTRVFRPVSDRHPDDEDTTGLLILRPEGRLFFGNADHFGQRIQPMLAEQRPRVLVLDMSAVFDVEYTALIALIDAEEKQRLAGTELWLTGVSPGVLATLRKSPLYDTLGKRRMFYTVADAYAAWLERASP
ncbi:SulP family inorganic anion transporter [Dyella jiangningensis]|uniref:Sodium-independent anion transporter n=1 Tax=Dyella jiangningensis TaxID=1379159 RepID=A0A328P770_9GAMM|nr:SulP family inorganic anion transporter [Dyella jiangningensis]RAO78137.1 sodium-independent anion transporter [Dyella jiangningensis]